MYDQDPKQCLTSNIIFEDPRDPLYCNSVISSSGKCKMCNNPFGCVQTSQYIPLPPRPKTCTCVENWLKSSEPITSHQTNPLHHTKQTRYITLNKPVTSHQTNPLHHTKQTRYITPNKPVTSHQTNPLHHTKQTRYITPNKPVTSHQTNPLHHTKPTRYITPNKPVTSHQTTRGTAQSDYRTPDFIWRTYTAMPVQFISHPNVVQIASRTDSSLTRVIVDVVLESQLCCQDSHGYLFL